ncbi:MAG: protein kinase, partial [Actinomycetota bacterium]|nr:protein kinase [Actinomycetota bacterium]
ALVLDLLAGGSLAALLSRRGRLRPGEVVTALAPVAAALAHAHERGVVHGDLSPGNVVFTAEGRPVLTDLGVARVLGEEAAGEVTPAYVDPTVARGGAPGPASDLFGVAAAAFHALTGVAPWNAATPADTLRVAADGVLPDLAELAPDAPPDLLAVISRGLSPDPHDRGSAAALALDLRHACRPEPVRLPRPGVPDEELARTGRGPRTELTHQVPGRHRRDPGEAAPARTGLRARLAPPGALLHRAGVLAGTASAAALVLWLGGWWGSAPSAPAQEPAASADRAAGGPGTPEPAASTPSGTAQPPTPSPAPEPPPAAVPEEDWATRLTELYARRAAAISTGSAPLLEEVYAPGSALLAADRDTVSALAAAGEALRGFAPEVVGAAVLDGSAGQGRVTLRVVDRWPAYEVVPAADAGGPALRSLQGRGETEVRMTLEAGPEGWRIASAERVT